MKLNLVMEYLFMQSSNKSFVYYKYCKKIRLINSSIKIFTFENTQAVTYSLKDIYKKFVYTENDFVLIGEPEEKINLICKNLNNYNELKKLTTICNSFQNEKRDLIKI